jgi:hypothetical protein
MEIKHQSTGNNDSIEDAVIAIMNIKTTEGKLINFDAQTRAVFAACSNIIIGKIKLEVDDADQA